MAEAQPGLDCLASGFPFVQGISVYESFESSEVAASGTAPMPEPGEVLKGGHAVLVWGYDAAAGLYRVRNSWSADWGQDGNFTLPFAYLTSPGLSGDAWNIRQVAE